MVELDKLIELVRMIRGANMATLDNLTAAVSTLEGDIADAAADVTAAIDALKAEIANLTAGAITQEQIDALAGRVDEVDSAVDDLDASSSRRRRPSSHARG